MTGARWTEDEVDFVKSNYVKMSCRKMAEMLPGRTERAVRHLFGSLGLKRPEPTIGDTFGKLTIISEKWLVYKPGQQGKGYVRVRCECGAEKDVRLTFIVNEWTVSCSCVRDEKARERVTKRNTTHGLTSHPLYRVYTGMVARCTYPSLKGYKDYGGRGIKVCEEWQTGFQAFYDWATTNGWQPGLTIERINNDGHYSPENCRFITRSEQNRNKRSTLLITAFGESKSLASWIDDTRCVANYQVVFELITKLGWEHERSLTTPTRMMKRGQVDLPQTERGRRGPPLRHGYSKTPLYHRWRRMLSRCYDLATPEYVNYGARGIVVCDEWHDFVNFLAWTKTSGYDPKLSIDRIDPNGHYEPSNCRWADAKTQAGNKR